MPRCVAAGCDNTHANQVSFHRFPKDENLFKKWVAAVSRTRKFFTGSQHSYVCSDHFTNEDYEARSLLANEIGLSGLNPKRLKKGSIPSVFSKPVTPGTVIEKKKKRLSSAYKKRERARVINENIKDVDIASCSASSSSMEFEDSNEFEPKFVDSETQTDEYVMHCDCCDLKKMKPKMKDFSIQFRTKAQDQGVQIFGEQDSQKKYVADIRSVKNEVEIKNQYDSSSEVKSVNEDGEWDEDEDEDDWDTDDTYADPDYDPTEDTFDEQTCSDYIKGDIYKGRKFLVFEDQLLAAFQYCSVCCERVTAEICVVTGTFCRIKQQCEICQHVRVWDSQPHINNTPAGNLLLSAATIFSGASVTKTYKLFTHLHAAVMTPQTFYQHQRCYLLPSIETLWAAERTEKIEKLKEEDQIILGGDGRCDSPGHSAKYGCYTLMNLKTGKIANVELVQSNEVKSSQAMEKEGLVRGIKSLQNHGVAKIDMLVTDRHPSIQKYVRENLKETTHKYDIWHIAKGVKKKIREVSRVASGKDVKLWEKSIINHLYWCATDTQSGDGQVMVAKWKSIINHMQNIHKGHDELFPECAHPEINEMTRKKKWLKTGSVATNKIADVVNNSKLLKDVSMMSQLHQTSKLEAFHSVLNHFAPKMFHYSYRVQKCRTLLAALHYNENEGRQQAETLEGEKRYSIVYPKFKKGEAVVKEVAVNATYEYVDSLVSLTIQYCLEDKEMPVPEAPPALCSKYNRLDKNQAIANHQSRFRHS